MVKRFCFDVHGRPTVFHEAEDVDETVRRYHQLQARVQRHHGSLRYEHTREKQYETPVRGLELPRAHRNVHNIRASDAPKRAATPPSIAEAAELASLQRKIKKPRSQLQRTYSESQEVPSLNQRAASGAFPEPSDPSPVTPDTDAGSTEMLPPRANGPRHEAKKRRSPGRIPQSKLRELQDNDDNEGDKAQDEDSTLGAPFFGKSSKTKLSYTDLSVASGAAATPPIVDTDPEPELELEQTDDAVFRRPVLPNILTSSQQDASLPSPSLSPITAAANLASRQNAFDASFARHIGDHTVLESGMELDDDNKTQSGQYFGSQTSSFGHKVPNLFQQMGRENNAAGPTVMDIPTMVDAYAVSYTHLTLPTKRIV